MKPFTLEKTSFSLGRLLVEPIVRLGLAEDMGRTGDITTDRIVPADTKFKGKLVARRPGRIAGLITARTAFELLDAAVKFKAHVADSDEVKAGDVIADIEGQGRALLTAERTALNFLCHLSGIATETAKLVAAIPKNVPARVIDTRKTNPGLRALEKYAVTCGGGLNHRFGLDDAIIVKDNHIAVAGSVREAIKRARENLSHMMKIQVEVDTLEQLTEVLASGRVDAVLLDNMDPDTLRKAVMQVKGKVITEASGNVNADNIAAIAASGVDLISVGWITHSAPILDIALDF